MQESSRQIVQRLLKEQGFVRPRDLRALGIRPDRLRQLEARGELTRIARGLYVASDAEPTRDQALAVVAGRVPRGVICLLTALRLHGFRTQNSTEIWLAIAQGTARPCIEDPPLRVVWFSKHAMTQGVEERRIEGVTVRVTSAWRTVVDCFKHRNKVGLETAVRALRAYRRRRDFAADEIWRYATLQRVARVMTPHLKQLGVVEMTSWAGGEERDRRNDKPSRHSRG